MRSVQFDPADSTTLSYSHRTMNSRRIAQLVLQWVATLESQLLEIGSPIFACHYPGSHLI